jgi:hypothetical protein
MIMMIIIQKKRSEVIPIQWQDISSSRHTPLHPVWSESSRTDPAANAFSEPSSSHHIRSPLLLLSRPTSSLKIQATTAIFAQIESASPSSCPRIARRRRA